MKNAKHALWPAAGLLAASLSVAAAAQNERKPAATPPSAPANTPARINQPRPDAPARMTAPIFDRVSRVDGYDIKNAADETVGSIEDLVIDRGSGRVEYVLIKSGGVLGMGGKTIAVPYGRLTSPMVKDKRFMVDMTKEQVEQAAAFVPENWAELRRDTWADRMHTQVTSAEQSDPDTDPTATAIAAAMEEALGGEVVAVKREWTGRDENVIVELRTKEGTVRDLQMGPSWWVMSQPGAPMRGDKFDAKVRVITKDGANPRYIVSNATVDGKTLVLRDSQFQPAWNVTDGVKPDDTKRATTRAVPSRLVLASEIVGADAVALDKDSADVEDAVMDLNSGTVVALCVDPNDSTLGWGDTKRLVPWSASTFATDGKVYIDANQQMLTAAPEVPKDLNEQPGWSQSVYSTFGMPAPRYDRAWDANRRTDRVERPADHKGHDDSSWTTAAMTGPVVTITGAVSRPRNEGIGKGNSQVTVVTVTSGNQVEEVVIAPIDYASTNKLAPAQGEQIEVTGRIMTLDGKRYLVAQKVTRNGRTTDIWTGDKPGWITKR